MPKGRPGRNMDESTVCVCQWLVICEVGAERPVACGCTGGDRPESLEVTRTWPAVVAFPRTAGRHDGPDGNTRHQRDLSQFNPNSVCFTKGMLFIDRSVIANTDPDLLRDFARGARRAFAAIYGRVPSLFIIPS